MTDALFTVEAAAEHLKLHAKTVLRFIREGRLRATKLGKQYRILQSDLDAFAGLSGARQAPAARVTAIVDVPEVDQPRLARLTSILLGAGGASAQRAEAMSIDIAYDPIRHAVKIIAVGTPADVAALLSLVDSCLEV